MSENVDQLKSLIQTTLDSRGVLAKLRAELRHHVFLALDEQETATAAAAAGSSGMSAVSSSDQLPSPSSGNKPSHIAVKKKKITELRQNPIAVDLVELIKDFCDCYELEYTSALIDTESEGVRPTSIYYIWFHHPTRMI